MPGRNRGNASTLHRGQHEFEGKCLFSAVPVKLETLCNTFWCPLSCGTGTGLNLHVQGRACPSLNLSKSCTLFHLTPRSMEQARIEENLRQQLAEAVARVAELEVCATRICYGPWRTEYTFSCMKTHARTCTTPVT